MKEIKCSTGETVRSYKTYLKTDHWKQTRIDAIERAGGTCSVDGCNETTYLQAHHLTYQRIGAELPSDLLILCQNHHYEEHRKMAAKDKKRKAERKKKDLLWLDSEKPTILRIIRNTNHPNAVINNISQRYKGYKLDVILKSKWFKGMHNRKKKSHGCR
tara:strand:- start:128 stop:604 length:477 start_codon:yes stop_codon:yes gene_type:complete